MRKLLFIILVSSLLLSLGFVGNGIVPAVKAAPSIYQGNLVLNGNNVTTITGTFDINGSIILEGNATLILKNAMMYFEQTNQYEYNMTLRNPTNGNPRLQSVNSTITSTSNYWFEVMLNQNSTAIFTDSTDTAYFDAYDSATASVSNSTIAFLAAGGSAVVSVVNSNIDYTLGAWGGSPDVSVSNSTIAHLDIDFLSVNCTFANVAPGTLTFWNSRLNSSMSIASQGYAPNVTITNTGVNVWQFAFEETTNAVIVDSQLGYLQSYNHSNVWLINSTVVSQPQFSAQGKVYVSWYLDVHVDDSIGNSVPSANVTATYPNATVAKLTGADGLARLTLMEKMINATGDYPVGNYTVEASYLTFSNSTTVNMTSNKQTELTLGLVIPEFTSFLILPFVTIATLLTVMICRRKHLQT